ncbi:MAG TPA: sterol desaturase family protein [Polyangiaceae bacterium]|nr:sterol desaturase family protein [Polyangiaceae bacterium]
MLQKLWLTLEYPLTYLWDWEKRLHWFYLLWCVLLAVIVYYVSDAGERRQGLLHFLFPKSVYRSHQAVVDLVFAYTERISYLLIITPLYLAMLSFGARAATFVAAQLMSRPHAWAGDLRQMTWLYTVLYFVVLDFSVFYSHWLQHKLPWLWEFHKVHHSAVTLTPVTVFRMHPIDYVLNLGLSGLLTGLFQGAFFYCFQKVSSIEIVGVNLILFVFYLSGFNLRHSHIWLSFGKSLSQWLISPAMHQVHHSKAQAHIDKNFGFFLSIWDKLFGALYIPQSKEELTLGLSDGTTDEYHSVVGLYYLPFKKWFGLLGHRAPLPAPTDVAAPQQSDSE